MKRPRLRRTLVRDFLKDESAGSLVETGLVLTLATTLVFVLRELIAGPLLQKFTAAARALERALN
jgi:Flp pilus assembly pilin Flp